MSQQENESKILILIEMADVFDRSFKESSFEKMVQLLEDIPAKDLQIAADHLMKTATRWPSLSEIIETAEKYGKPYEIKSRGRWTPEQADEFSRSVGALPEKDIDENEAV